MATDFTGIGAVAESAKGILAMIFPDKTESEKAQLAGALALVQAQTNINEQEAKNPSMFVSGARPFIMWVCGVGCAWNWIGLPIAKFGCALSGHDLQISAADLSEMMPLLLGMLGLGGLRTVEKLNGVAAVTHK